MRQSGPAETGEDADEEARADAAAGYGKFLTFNVSVDAARVQDILTAIAYAQPSGGSGCIRERRCGSMGHVRRGGERRSDCARYLETMFLK